MTIEWCCYRPAFTNESFEHLTLDTLDRTTNRTVPGSSSDLYTYDPAGRMIDAIKAGFGTLHHDYDSAGRLTAVTWPGGQQVGYHYDAASNVTRMTYPDGSYVVYDYDELGRMTEVKYDPNAESVDPAPATIATYQYDALSRRSNLTYANNASTSYGYSLDGNPTNLTFQAGGSSSTLTYGYDKTGLRTSMTVNDERFEPKFLLSGQRGINSNNLNQYTSVTGKALAYDGNGNLSYDGVFTYVHDALNRLVSAHRQEATNTYQYGPLGRRTSKTASSATTNYIYTGDHAAVEYDQGGTLVRKFIYGPGIDEPLVMITPGEEPNTETKHYYHADALGSVIGLTNATGAWAETYSYSAWGELNGYSSVGNPYFYTGRRYDTETGLYYYRARYYDAYLKRFIQPDPIGFEGGMNWYAYVGNSPLNYVDPYGEWWQLIAYPLLVKLGGGAIAWGGFQIAAHSIGNPVVHQYDQNADPNYRLSDLGNDLAPLATGIGVGGALGSAGFACGVGIATESMWIWAASLAANPDAVQRLIEFGEGYLVQGPPPPSAPGYIGSGLSQLKEKILEE